MTDIQKLKALAEVATQGEWTCAEKPDGRFWHIRCGSQAIGSTYAASKKHSPDYAAIFEANAKFIAAANPAAVLELIAELEKFDDGMRALAFRLGAGGYNAVTLTADQLVAKVSDGLEMFTTATGELLDKVTAERVQLKATVADYEMGLEAAKEEIARLKGENEGLRKQIPSQEVIWCACGDGYPVNSYGAGFMDANGGVCGNCDAANGGVETDLDTLRKDAERYRWLSKRDRWASIGADFGKGGVYRQHRVTWHSEDNWPQVEGQSMDEAIDAAMNKGEQP